MKYNQLSSEQRYAIYLGLQRKWSMSKIAREIGVAVSTVSREIKRNSNRNGQYVWLNAQKCADLRRHSINGNHRKDEILWLEIERLLVDEDFSPEQIAGTLRRNGVKICKQTIYNHIHADETGRLAQHTPHQLRYKRRKKHEHITKATNIRNRTSIHERPKEADGKRFGDWEMDTIVDGYGHVILTLTERSTNYILMEKLPQGKKAKALAKVAVRLLFPFREHVLTITTDNGSEFAEHEYIAEKLSIKSKGHRCRVFFTDAYSSWQK